MTKAVQVGSYADFFRVLGLEAVPLEYLRPGRFNRISREGRRRDDAGFVILHADGSLWGGNHALADVYAYFNPSSNRRLTSAEWSELKRRNREIRERERAEQLRRQDAAALNAVALMRRAEPYHQHPYMISKHLCGDSYPTLRVIRDKVLRAVLGYLPSTGEDGARMSGEILLAPMYAAVRGRPVLRNVQMIDRNGVKRFLPGGQKKDCFWCSRCGIRETQGILGVCEGVATGLSVAVDVAEKEGQIPIFAAMDAGNLPGVAMIVQRLFFDRELVIFGDWDESGRGQEAAREAAAQTRSGRVQFPPIDEQITARFQRVTGADKVPSDFNDYLIAVGRL